MKKLAYLLFPVTYYLLPVLLTACVDEYNAELPTSDSNLLVVEGAILSDTTSTFYLSLTTSLNSTDTVFVENATIQLAGTDGTLVDGVHKGDGEYAIATPKLNSDAKYNVVIKYDGETFESEALTPLPTTGIESVEAEQLTDTSSVNILITTAVPNNSSETQYYKWIPYETWEVYPDYKAIYYWDTEANQVKVDRDHFAQRGWKYDTCDEIIATSSAYYGNNQIARYKLYDVDRSDRRLYVLYSTDIWQRSITKEEYEYETERKKISKDMGGLFTPQPSALPSNIHCTSSDKRTIGYVGCSLNTAHYRLFVYADEVSIVKIEPTITTQNNLQPNYPGNDAMYRNGWLVADYVTNPPPLTITWMQAKYIDLTKNDCSIEKPSYWPY